MFFVFRNQLVNRQSGRIVQRGEPYTRLVEELAVPPDESSGYVVRQKPQIIIRYRQYFFSAAVHGTEFAVTTDYEDPVETILTEIIVDGLGAMTAGGCCQNEHNTYFDA